ncbi:MAG TPA: aspartate--tRNA ligase [Acidimicrobiales bacterium]|nr:aspartate--tRNA ligase [Acidimicrobiales bacterium]
MHDKHDKPESAAPPPLAPNLYRDTRCGALRRSDIERRVHLAGWVAAKRDHGGLLFIDLRDPAGPDADLLVGQSDEDTPVVGRVPCGDHRARVVQLVCHPGSAAFQVLSHLRIESVVSITGMVVARPAENVNPELLTGEVEVEVGNVEVLSSSDVLPFPVERDTDVGEEARLTYRYLDMRRGPLVERLAKRARFCQLVRTHLSGRGFLEVQTPVLTASSPEGARDYLVPSRLYPGEFYALPQAPQQFKQLLMVGGIERYFQIAPCFRDEASRADRSPGEFYQIDLEMAFATQEDVFREVELLFGTLVSSLSGKRAPAPYPRLSYADALARYGTDKPDLRFGLEIEDLTTELGGRTELPMFAEAPARGNAIRALLAPSAADRSRSWFDGFSEATKSTGTIGSWLQLPADGGETKGPLARRLTSEEIRAIVAATGASHGDAVLTGVGPGPSASVALGQVRSALGHELGLADHDLLAFCWIVDFPMFERNSETGEWDFSHNPFSMPQGGLEALESKGPGEVLAFQYDVVCNGLELSSGAVRNHLPEVMEKAFGIAGYSRDRLERSFPALWNAFRYGPPPHAGIAPGVDRLLMLLEDQPNIREVIAFPLNQMARDLLMGAPAPVTPAQLSELHLQVVPPKKS